MAAFALLLAACGGEAGEAPETSAPTTTVATTEAPEEETTTTESETTTTAAEVDLASFCETAVQADITASAGPEVDFEIATEEEIAEAMAAFSAELTPLLEELEQEAPEEVAEQVGTVADQLRQGLETGEPVFDDPAFQEADREVDRFIVENCDIATVEVTGTEYAFEGAPETVDPGMTAFHFSNEGGELHELVLFRLGEATDASVEELLELPEEEAEQLVQFVGFTIAPPGEESIAFADLEPGRYGMVCFIPVGTTSMEGLPQEEGEPAGPPHFAEGMFAEFEVSEG